MKKLAVLLTCYNRVNTTLECLEYLYNTTTPDNFVVDIYLLDDNSPDNTGTVVKKKYNEINIIQGTGNLFWNRGMRIAWNISSKNEDYDFFIWLNDDTLLHSFAIEELLEISKIKQNKAIICGATQSQINNEYTYGGKDKRGNKVLPNNKFKEVTYLNGNIVLIPSSVYKRNGNLDGMFHHHLGDWDYGLRAIKNGIQIYTTSKYIGFCEKNPISQERSRKNGMGLVKRIQVLYSPIGSNPIIYFRYYKRHYGLLKAIKLFTYLHLINILNDEMFLEYTNKKSKTLIKEK